eukprot:GHUV01001965.1.p1 GENE.GHUV01001965.1~~GHUV01001965.1.p1  ORF type:complete len:491 (+),score=177.40 GHUV01001965.1:514-1986(+)
MLAALPTATAPVTAVLAGLFGDDLCKGPQPALQQVAALPSIMQLQAQPDTGLQQPPSQPQPQQEAPLSPSHVQPQQLVQLPQMLLKHQTSVPVDIAVPQQQPQEQQRQHRPRRPSRSAPVSPVRGNSPPQRAGYSTDAYWDNRYAERSTHFDWFFNYSALASLINMACEKFGPCLHVGCGNSGLSVGMVKDGFEVVNVDISAVVIEQMRRKHGAPGHSWEVADCRSMPQYPDASFGSVLDKGTLDAVLCSSHGQADTIDYVNEVHRLLMPGGVFLLISLGQPHARLAALNALSSALAASLGGLQYLSDKYRQLHLAVAAAAAAAASKGGSGYGWSWESVEIYLLPKPSLYLAGECSLTGRAAGSADKPPAHTDKDMPIVWMGPYAAGEELDKAVADQGLDLREYFTAFVCKKAKNTASAQTGSPAVAAAAKKLSEGMERLSVRRRSKLSDNDVGGEPDVTTPRASSAATAPGTPKGSSLTAAPEGMQEVA